MDLEARCVLHPVEQTVLPLRMPTLSQSRHFELGRSSSTELIGRLANFLLGSNRVYQRFVSRHYSRIGTQ